MRYKSDIMTLLADSARLLDLLILLWRLGFPLCATMFRVPLPICLMEHGITLYVFLKI